jgi:Holliday junction resolvase RusA-like endonuclease
MITIAIPGRPPTYRRARSKGAIRFQDKATIADRQRISAAVASVEPCPPGALAVDIVAIWPAAAARSKARKGQPRPVIVEWRDQDPDADNVAKGVLDGLQAAGWLDEDNRVVRLTACTLTTNQHGAGCTLVTVSNLLPDAASVALSLRTA